MNNNFYTIEKVDHGIRLVFSGLLSNDNIRDWLAEFKKMVNSINNAFTVFVDMRDFKPLSAEGQTIITDGQEFAIDNGMARSVVILDNPITTLQFKRIAQKSGIFDNERYIDASRNPDWEKIGLDWLIKEIDPDLKTALTNI